MSVSELPSGRRDLDVYFQFDRGEQCSDSEKVCFILVVILTRILYHNYKYPFTILSQTHDKIVPISYTFSPFMYCQVLNCHILCRLV